MTQPDQMSQLMLAINEELEDLGLRIDAAAFVWLVLEALMGQRKRLAQKVTHSVSAAEIAAYTAGGFELRERIRQGPGPLEQTMAEYIAMIADALSKREAALLLAVHPATIQYRLHRRLLFGIRLRGRWLLPRFQFGGNAPLPGLETVLPAIDPDAHPVSVARFFYTLQSDLVVADIPGAVSPRDWLLMGHSPIRVAALARQLVLV